MIGILGASGYIGHCFSEELVKQETYFREFSRSKHDYYDLEYLIHLIHSNEIKTLINCAGYTGKPNVDACEYNKDECYEANVELAKTVSTACALTDTKLMHISSGCIYSGDKDGKGFTEEDPPNFHSGSNPKGSFYSGTKAVAESVVGNSWEKTYIPRLRIPFDEEDSPRNYLSKLQKYDKLLDAVNSVSHKREFVQACIHLIQKECDYGIYNIVNTNPINTKQVAELLKEYKLIDSYDILSEEEFYKNVDVKAPRSNCILDNSKIIDSGFDIRNSVDAIRDSLEGWKGE